LWFAAAHAPDTGLLIPMNSLFLEHWMYLPSAGLFLGIAQTFVVLMKDRPRVLPILCSSIALLFAGVLSIKTYSQNKIWHDPVSFYNNIFAYGEKSSRAHNNLALYYSDNGQYDAAIEQFNKAIASGDIYAETRYNLAVTLSRKSQNKETLTKIIDNLERSIKIQPSFYRSYQLLGDIYDLYLHDKEKGDLYRAHAKEILNQQK
jgi:tetratricopeptide (TPR) repeat protein